MSCPLYDFIHCPEYPDGLGIFKGDKIAMEVAATTCKFQKRKFKRYKTVPSTFYVYLKRIGIINQNEPIPKFGSTIGELLNFLQRYPFKNENDRVSARYICEEFLKAEYPMLKSSFASSVDSWEELQLGKGRRWR